MSPHRTELALEHTVGNSTLGTQVPGLHEHNLDRDAGLRIRGGIAASSFYLIGLDDLFPSPEVWEGEIALGAREVFGHVQDCRSVWQQTIVDYTEVVDTPALAQSNSFPFQDQWEHQGRPATWLRELGARLAVAGDQLFFLVFENSDDGLRRVASRLREASSQRCLVLTITAEAFFVPWGLLYTHPDLATPLAPDGSNFVWEGFWGYRHIVEHNTAWVELETELKLNSNGLLAASINVDERIDTTLNVKCIEPQLTFFRGLTCLNSQERHRKAELQQALASDSFADQIIYFCCHGIGAGQVDQLNLQNARISLTDGESISGADIVTWRRRRDLSSHPLVFINACQGGQMTTMFYQSLGAELLKLKAIGLIGAQVDIPALFAAEYARRFFTLFLSGTRERVGPLMRTLARTFLDQHQNPLGLVYSLYRGADCFVGN